MSKRADTVNPFEESLRVVWHEPTQFDPILHGPPYLPTKSTVAKLSHDQKAEVRRLTKTASSLVLSAESPLLSTLAVLQALLQLHQSHHWSVKGATFFEDHLMYERIYNESLELIDRLAERTVGSGEVSVISAAQQAQRVAQILSGFIPTSSASDMVSSSLQAETACLSAIAQLIATLETQGTLTPGISNLLEGIADVHETFVYLLNQRTQAASYDYR